MSHSHLAIRHLVKQLEMTGPRAPRKASLPPGMQQFIDALSQRFEPFSGVARVGYECFPGEDAWELSLYLGEHEIVGGPEDGELRPINFRFDLTEIARHFDALQTVCWNAFPDRTGIAGESEDLSCLTLQGTVCGEQVRVQIHAGPCGTAGPAIREHLDGRLEVV